MSGARLDGNPAPYRWVIAGIAVLAAHAALYALLPAGIAPQPRPAAIVVDLVPDPAPPQPLAEMPAPAPPPAAEPPQPASPPPLDTPPPVPAAPLDLPLPPSRPVVQAKPRPSPRRVSPRHVVAPPESPAPLPEDALRAEPHPAPSTASVPPAGNPATMPAWQAQLMRRLHQALRYPAAARENEQEGTALITFTMTREGHVLSAALTRSSGRPALDAEAVAMVRRADPLPPPPAEAPGQRLTLVVPVQFSLRDLR